MRSAIEWVRILTWGAIPKRERNIKEIQADALRWAYGQIASYGEAAQDKIEAKVDELDPP